MCGQISKKYGIKKTGQDVYVGTGNALWNNAYLLSFKVEDF